MSDFANWTVVETAAAVAARRVSARELVAAAFDRVDRWEPHLNAFVATFRDEALSAADRADAKVRRGETLPRLHGVPLAHKDLYYRVGRVSGCGTGAVRLPSTTTSTLLERLDAAGAIELGRLHMCEYALGPSGHNAWLGDCHNPWQLEHVPGGSSSGSGAAVAARIVPLSLGSDTGGSIRLPASLCGVLGLKPTFGLLSRHGMLALSPSLDTPGICARGAADIALVLGMLIGADRHDPTTARAPHARLLESLSAGSQSPFTLAKPSRPLDGLRVGTSKALDGIRVDDDVATVLMRSLRHLAALGAEIVEVELPNLPRLSELNRVLVYVEAAAIHAERLRANPTEYSPQVRIRAATGLAIPHDVYERTLAMRAPALRAFLSGALADCDVLHLPTLPVAAPKLGDTDVGGAAPMWQTIAAMVPCTAPFNYLGLPALSMPCGFTANGLPAACQLVGRPYAEATLLRVAKAQEPFCEPLLRGPVPPTA
jgi:aspartyl-tRNA(Asn)/glutamyl-tRNA(Gln) amidotransferase subunit A